MLSSVTFFLSKAIRRFRPAAMWRCSIHPRARVLAGSDLSDVVMGRYSYCGYGCRINKCDIGSFCSIAENVAIGFGEHRVDAVATSPVFNVGQNILKRNFAELPRAREPRTKIGNDVWIGLDVIIKAGITIGDGAVIGAGSVVTKDVPPYAVWAGVPAREIRKRFDEPTIRALIDLRWWDWPEDRIEEFGEAFGRPEDLLRRGAPD